MPRIGDRQLPGHRIGWHRHAPVVRDEYIDRPLDLGRAHLTERAREGIDNVREAAGLRPRLALGRDEGDAHAHAGSMPAGTGSGLEISGNRP